MTQDTNDWNYQYFKESEFACACCGESKMDAEFMRKIVNLRRAIGPIIINSGYRCEAHNKAVGGGKYSVHLEGKAADIKVMGKRANKFVSLADYCGFYGIGVKQKGEWTSRFIHIDTGEGTKNRSRPWMWSY